MELHLVRGGSREDLEDKKYNIGVGISLGNKWFSVENILELIRWALPRTRESVVVYAADSIHAINLEVRKRIRYEKALALANQLGDELLGKLQIETSKAFSPEELGRIHFAKWDSIVDESYKAKRQFLYEFYENNSDFREAVEAIARHAVSKEIRSFSETEIHRLGMYVLEEMPEQLARVAAHGIVWDAFVYPYDGEIPRLNDRIQQGKEFPEIRERVMDTQPKVFLEVR